MLVTISSENNPYNGFIWTVDPDSYKDLSLWARLFSQKKPKPSSNNITSLTMVDTNSIIAYFDSTGMPTELRNELEFICDAPISVIIDYKMSNEDRFSDALEMYCDMNFYISMTASFLGIQPANYICCVLNKSTDKDLYSALIKKGFIELGSFEDGICSALILRNQYI